MAYNHEYPYFDSGQFNADWLLNKIKEIEEELSGTKTYDYKGENEVLDLNELRPNSMASFTENFNVLNAPVSGARRFVFTNGSTTGGLQRCYDLKMMEVYTRNFTITNGAVIWGSWEKTQLKPDTIMNSVRFITNTSLDDNEPNTVTWVQGGNGSITNAPTGYNGFVLDWKSEGASPRIQVWFDMATKFIYIRTLSGGTWTVWQEANHIDFTDYFKYSHSTSADLNSLPVQRAYICNNNNNNLPAGVGSATVLTVGEDSGYRLQIAVKNGSLFETYTRASYNGGSSWTAWAMNTFLWQGREYSEIESKNSMNGALYAVNIENRPTNSNGFVTIYGQPGIALQEYYAFNDVSQYLRFQVEHNIWREWHKVGAASTRTLIAGDLPVYKTEKEEFIEPNFYSEIARETTSEYLNCPGQSLYHSDPDAQSYSEAIRAREDLTSFDAIITNLEQWDMDIPLTELLEKTREFVQGIKDSHPLADIVILSVPPVDVPFLGKELYSNAWRSGNTLTEVDDALTALAQEVGFSYITWKDYKYIDNTNLLRFYANLYEEPVYKRSLQSYVSRQVKNYIE